MWKLAAISVIAYLLVSCSVVSSHATAARELRHGRDLMLYCWRRGAGNYSGPCVEEDLDKSLWECAHRLSTIDNEFQPLETSRSEIIACMHEKDWQEYEMWISG